MGNGRGQSDSLVSDLGNGNDPYLYHDLNRGLGFGFDRANRDICRALHGGGVRSVPVVPFLSARQASAALRGAVPRAPSSWPSLLLLSGVPTHVACGPLPPFCALPLLLSPFACAAPPARPFRARRVSLSHERRSPHRSCSLPFPPARRSPRPLHRGGYRARNQG